MSRLSDSSDDEPAPPTKRKRYNTTGASSQSSSGAENANISDSKSQSDSDNESPPPSFGSFQFPDINNQSPQPMSMLGSSIGEKIMRKTGYTEGKGLGKYGQGRVNPIEASTQRGRIGFGFQSYSKGGEYQGPNFDPSMENLTAEETPIWMESSPDEVLDRDLLESWMVLGPKKMTIDDETWFCDSEILQDILSLKTALDSMTAEDLRRVRSLCNPFEKIGNAFFVNRAALKMANMDAVFDFMFTNPKDKNRSPLVGPNDLLYFADVCAGPGGFTEYVLWKKKWIAKGFGFTLKASNDFKLSELHAASTETFTPYYGKAGDGDIFNPENLESLKEFVLKNTIDKGVHFLMADGGFSVEGQENIQEILSKQLYVCQCIAALSIVREGGCFVVKLFDIFTEFSAGLIYLMYRSFDKICIHKPNTSRPANSERYLICKGKRASSDTIERHLIYVNTLLWACRQKRGDDVTILVPLDTMRQDEAFYNYILESNNRIGIQQKTSLLKVIEYHKNPGKYEETRHSEMRAACLKLWKIPDQVRIVSHHSNPRDALKSVLSIIQNIPHIDYNFESLTQALQFKPKIVKKSNDLKDSRSGKSIIGSPLDWKFVFLNNYSGETTDNKFHFYLGSAGSNVYEFDGKRWKPFHDIRLPADTLILAEKVQENCREGRAMLRTYGLHIIDAFCLGGVCILHKELLERYNKIALFCAAHNKPHIPKTENTRIPLRCKKLFNLENLQTEMSKLVKRQLKRMSLANTTPVPNTYDNSDLYYVTKSILLIKNIKEPWIASFSKTHRRIYYFDCLNNKSSYECPREAVQDTFGALKTHVEWTDVEEECHDNSFIRCLMNQ